MADLRERHPGRIPDRGGRLDLANGRTQAFWIILAITYVIAIAGFSHSIVGADETFLLLFTGRVDAMRAVFGLMLPAILGNLVGGGAVHAAGARPGQGETRE